MLYKRMPVCRPRRWWSLGAAALAALALTGAGCGSGGSTAGAAVNEDQVAPAMAAFSGMDGELDAASESVDSGSNAASTVGAMMSADRAAGHNAASAAQAESAPVSNSIELNIEQDASLSAVVDLDKKDGSGNDLYPYHTGKVSVTATGNVTGTYAEDGTGSVNGSVAYQVNHTVTQAVVYSRGLYSSTIAAGATAQHTLNASWVQSGGNLTHTVTAHKLLSNFAITVSGPNGTVHPTISCDITATATRINGAENENTVTGWWQATFANGGTVRVSLLIDDKPGTANDVCVVSVTVNGVLTSTNFSLAAFEARHPNCHLDILGRFWVAAYLRIDSIFSHGERAWHAWDRVIEGVSKAIDATARATGSGTPLNYQATASGTVTFPTADVPDLSGTVTYTANGSVSSDGATFADVTYGVTVSAASDLVYTPAAGYQATLAAGANEAWNLGISVTRTDSANYTIHLAVDGTQSVPSLVVVSPSDTLTLSSSVAVSGTYDEAAVAGAVTKDATLHAEWTVTAANSDGTVTAHRKLDLEITS